MTLEPVHALAVLAIVGPAVLVVQTRRKRLRVYCCSGAAPAACDLRMTASTDAEQGSSCPSDGDRSTRSAPVWEATFQPHRVETAVTKPADCA